MDEIYRINSCKDAHIAEHLFEFDVKSDNPSTAEHRGRHRRAAIYDEEYEWEQNSNGMVYIPYLIGSDVAPIVRGVMAAAIQDFNQYTCIRFVPRQSESDFVYIFTSGFGCYANVGKQKGLTQVSLDEICGQKGIALHELMHVLGFRHEQGRRDRGRYITIHYDRIKPEYRNQFTLDEYGKYVVYGTEYDGQSLMHYGNRVGGLTPDLVTISSKVDPSQTFGQRNGFSTLDLREINLKYKCGKQYVNYD
ncbi:hatching enzyme 1.2-like isoform X2 [Clytia hemisphaerica]